MEGPGCLCCVWGCLARDLRRSPRAGRALHWTACRWRVLRPICRGNRRGCQGDGIDIVQLHGSAEADDMSKHVPGRPTIRAVHVGESDSSESVKARIARTVGNDALILLDTKVGAGMQGGSGVVFDWAIARDVVVGEAGGARFPVLLAGGLSPDNVKGVLGAVDVAGVDVSSGVETDGVKDHAKIRAFVQAVRNY
eukprot:Opistho-2@33137